METTELKHIQTILMRMYVAFLGTAALIAVLGETGVIPNGVIAHLTTEEYYAAIVMELLTICIIPVALKLFKLKGVERQLQTKKALLPWGTVRMTMLGVPMAVNAVLYYLFYNVAFGYMAIILFLCFFFITPTMQRCEEEIRPLSVGDEAQTTHKE